MASKDVDSHNGLLEVWVGTLNYIVIGMLFVAESVQSLEDEFEEGFQIFRVWRCDEDV